MATVVVARCENALDAGRIRDVLTRETDAEADAPEDVSDTVLPPIDEVEPAAPSPAA